MMAIVAIVSHHGRVGVVREQMVFRPQGVASEGCKGAALTRREGPATTNELEQLSDMASPQSLSAAYQALRKWLYRYGFWTTLFMVALIAAGSFLPPGSVGDPGSYGGPAYLDKLAHVLAYSAAVLPAASANFRMCMWAVMIVPPWAAVVELLQPLVGRSADIGDLVANIAGIVAGLVIGRAIYLALRERANASP